MTIRDEVVLRSFRGPGPCAWCGVQAHTREAAHVVAKGMGGRPLDVRINLVSLGIGGWVGVRAVCNCHAQSHAGHEPTSEQLLEIAARREGTTPADAQAVLWMLVRLPKHPTAAEIRRELGGLTDGERTLAERVLREIEKHLPEQTRSDLKGAA